MIAAGMARALTLGFVVGGAAPIGAVLMLAIARLVGADWGAVARLARPLPMVAIAGALAMLAWWGRPVPEHLATWEAAPFVAVRALVAVAVLAWAARKLATRWRETGAGVVLALYAALATPIAADWLLPGDPGHGVSAIGMIVAVGQIGGAAALLLARGEGDAALRRDMAKLLVAAALGLGYLAFMDYLIVWFGNLPDHVGFYVVRGTPVASAMAALALVLGLGGTIAALTLLPGRVATRAAGWSALGGLLLFDGWWLAAGWIVTLIVGLVLAPLAMIGAPAREVAHG